MKKRYIISAFAILAIIAVSSSGSRPGEGTVPPLTASAKIDQVQVKIEKNYGKMPLIFVPNQGQMDRSVYYYVQGKDKTVYFTSEGLTYSLNASGSQEIFTNRPPAPRGLDPDKTFNNETKLKEPSHPSQRESRWVVKLEFIGARTDAKPEPLEQSGTRISYFKGPQKEWITGLQAASKIRYRDLWPGIDLVYYGTINRMKYEFIVHPGADPAQIKLAYRGAESVKENSQRQLEVQTPVGGFFDDTPVAWQEIDGKRENVDLKYSIENRKSEKETRKIPVVTYGFTVGKYDPKQVLILDPAVLVYCGYIGGINNNYGRGIAVDATGCAYITGYTQSTEASFPETVGPDLTFNGGFYDAFVAKVNADGTGLVYCGYIGGSSYDYGNGIAVDAAGCAYITGRTGSSETTFPVAGGLDITYNGSYDAFVAKVNASGTGLIYCGYIGGSVSESGSGIAIDGSGCAYITGYTDSSESTFPVTVGPGLTHNEVYDTFVAKINAAGTAIEYCGYIGGSGMDQGYSIAVDAAGCAYIAGYTQSTEATFPVTVGPDLTYNAGSTDGFVAKINASGTALEYCGYIGGSSSDSANGIALDASGCPYVTGYTFSTGTSFPVTVGPDLTINGSGDAFIAKVNAAGTALVYCGYIGGAGDDEAKTIAVDTSNCAYISGKTSSNGTTFPVALGPDLTFNGNNDAFVAKVNADGTTLVYCGYIGGSENDNAYSITVDESGCAFIAGDTLSLQPNFPVTVGPDLTFNGSSGNANAFVTKIFYFPQYKVSFIAGSGGTLSGITTQTVVQGGNCTEVEAVAYENYTFANWTGTGGFVTTTDNPLTVANVTSDMTITANFAFTAPEDWIPVEGLPNSMTVSGNAYNGNNLAAKGDWLGAFGPGGTPDCRGIVSIQTGGDYSITIGSNETSGETITFKLYPLPSGPAIDGSESISFIANGGYSDFPLHFGPREQAFNLVSGWNWISFNTLPDDTSFNAIFGTPGPIEQIKCQNKAAIYSGGNWIGDLTGMSGIADGIMYKVKTSQAYAFNVTGNTIPYNTPLSLVTGWNWTAYLPTLSQPVADAVDSIITPVSQVKSQTKSVIKINTTLYGDLTDMESAKGYLILMNQAGVLEYQQGEAESLGLSAEKTAVTNVTKTPPVSWPVIKGNQYNMVALGTVYFEGKPVKTTGYYLGSQGPKGDTDGRSLSPVKTGGAYFATILGNTNNETITFKLINSKTNRAFDMAGTLIFRADSLKTGIDLKARSVRLTAPKEGAALPVGATCAISWQAYELNNVKIEIYKGGKFVSVIAASVPAGTASYRWKIPANLESGKDYQVKATCIDAGVTAIGWTKTFVIVSSGT